MSAPNCPKCQSPMRERSGSKGPFWGCTKYPECKGTVPMEGQAFAPRPSGEINKSARLIALASIVGPLLPQYEEPVAIDAAKRVLAQLESEL